MYASGTVWQSTLQRVVTLYIPSAILCNAGTVRRRVYREYSRFLSDKTHSLLNLERTHFDFIF
jgi:hypothetical protein